jgi:hypothetical protein
MNFAGNFVTLGQVDVADLNSLIEQLPEQS